jgi:DtxR family transcriptional regulator, Mn-dependent transcriptional regulator
LKISESAQEQLEQLWISSEETPSALPMPPVSNADPANEFEELRRLGLVEFNVRGVALTTAGHQEAAMAIRRHRLAERLFTDILVTDSNLIEERACSMEHALFDGVDESICTLLGHPSVCPHGNPIPPGRCCEQMRTSLNSLIAPLKELKRGQSGQIAYLHMENPQRLHKLMAMGVLPGVALKVKETYPSYVFEAGYSQFAVDGEIAGDIFVRLAPAKA